MIPGRDPEVRISHLELQAIADYLLQAPYKDRYLLERLQGMLALISRRDPLPPEGPKEDPPEEPKEAEEPKEEPAA